MLTDVLVRKERYFAMAGMFGAGVVFTLIFIDVTTWAYFALWQIGLLAMMASAIVRIVIERKLFNRRLP